jgi:hypothetical protein
VKKALVYGAVLIGLYIVVVNGTNSGTVINDAVGGISTDVKTLQGR